MALPKEFCARMEALLSHDAPLFFESLEQAPRRALRFDGKLLDQRMLSLLLGEALKEEVPFGENAFYFELDGIGNTPLHHSGAIYVQEPAAMAPVAALGKKKVRAILDLCSAPGGKSLQAAASILEEDGILVCNEPVPLRRKALMQNLERMGERRCLVTGFDATHLPAEFEGCFDLVIADAPCSGEGMMRKHEEACTQWSIEHILSLSALQKNILESAARALSPGGRLLYSTCTWAKEENEENIAHFLSLHPDFSFDSPNKAVAMCAKEGELPGTLRFYPHLFPGEGQFLAILKKEGEDHIPVKKKKKEKGKKPDPREKAVADFLCEQLTHPPAEKILFREDEIFLVKDAPFPAQMFISPGVLVGSMQKGRVVPHHRFFRAFAGNFKNQFVLEYGDPRIEAYLRGEEIPLEGKGYGVLFAGTLPLGGVKASGGRGKNLYPKGLRKA